jgi:prepilin-type N-terminal cleavage/methylation domain-containing protein
MSTRARGRLTRSAASRGFTLVELLVALSCGLFVSVVVFNLARDASRFYQREGRAANATLVAIAGFERLRLDIARAGYMASPNVAADPFVCTRPGATAPVLMQRLAAIRIMNQGSPSNTVLAANSLAPDSLILAGSYSSPDEYAVERIGLNANLTSSVELNPLTPAMARLGYTSAATPELKTERLQSVFAVGRAVRIVDTRGHQHYGLIQSVSSGASGDDPRITLAATIPLRYQTSGQLCGIVGNGTGATINVVNFIRYDVHKMVDDGDGAPYNALFAARTGTYGETERTELVRGELDPADASGTALLSGTPEELVAEYAVDFELEPTAVTGAPSPDPTLTQLPSSHPSFAAFTGATGAAQRIRSVRVRLGVRTREGDRNANVPATADVAPGTYRVLLGTEGSGDYAQQRWARIRTLQADVVLNNLLGVNW